MKLGLNLARAGKFALNNPKFQQPDNRIRAGQWAMWVERDGTGLATRICFAQAEQDCELAEGARVWR